MYALTKGPSVSVPLKRGEWRRFLKSAVVSCPKCGFCAQLDHEIAADGTISPSVVCPQEGCDFHQFCKLEGWSPLPLQ